MSYRALISKLSHGFGSAASKDNAQKDHHCNNAQRSQTTDFKLFTKETSAFVPFGKPLTTSRQQPQQKIAERNVNAPTVKLKINFIYDTGYVGRKAFAIIAAFCHLPVLLGFQFVLLLLLHRRSPRLFEKEP